MYHLNDIYLRKSDSEKMLGVYIYNQLSFCQHVYYVIDKARKMCNLLFRSFTNSESFCQHVYYVIDKARKMCNLLFRYFTNCEPKIVVDLYKVYARKIIDYFCVVYSPN